MFKKRIFLILFVLLFMVSTAFASQDTNQTQAEEEKSEVAVTEPVIAARVGSQTITMEQLDEKVRDLVSLSGYNIEDIPEEIINANKKEILQKMVNDLALDAYIKDKNISISQESIDKRADEIISSYPSLEEFEKVLARQGYTMDSFRDEIKRELHIDQIIKSRGYVDPTEDEMMDFYLDQIQGFRHNESVKTYHILVSFDKYQEEEALERINMVKEKIADPEKDFENLAGEYSDCPSSSRGGDLGFFERGRMVKPFEDAAFTLETGHVSDPVKTQFGYHLIYVTEKRGEGVYDFAEKRDEIFNALKRNRVSEYVGEFFKDLNESYNIEILL